MRLTKKEKELFFCCVVKNAVDNRTSTSMASPHLRSSDCSSEHHPIRNEFKIDEQKTKEKKKRYENAIPFLFFPSAGATLDDLRSLKMPVVLM